MKDWYTAGEISSLFGLNVQTLHYYESIGLFSPIRRRAGTGVRYYQFDQIYKLATIRFLKRLNYPLKRIRENLDSRGVDFSLEQMRSQSAQLEGEIEALRKIKEAIDRKVRFVEERLANIDTDAIRQADFPLRRYLPIGMEDLLYRSEEFYFYPTVVFYEKVGKRFGALLIENASRTEAGEIPSVEAGRFLVAFHRGPYERIGVAFDRLRSRAAELGLDLADESVNVNIVDQFIERDPERFITEVQMRIRG